MPRIKKILAPTDFSELSKLGIRYALELARDTSAEVIIYHSIDFGDEWSAPKRQAVPYSDILEDSRKKLESFLAENFADSMNLVEVRKSAEIGTPTKSIAEKAASEGVDLIVMSTHGRTGLEHMILGSVSEKVVARAPCPVLVVPRAGRAGAAAKAA